MSRVLISNCAAADGRTTMLLEKSCYWLTVGVFLDRLFRGLRPCDSHAQQLIVEHHLARRHAYHQ